MRTHNPRELFFIYLIDVLVGEVEVNSEYAHILGPAAPEKRRPQYPATPVPVPPVAALEALCGHDESLGTTERHGRGGGQPTPANSYTCNIYPVYTQQSEQG